MLVNILNIEVLENPTSFDKPFQLEITFECLQELHTDLEWKVIYVGSAESSSYDQILEELLVGPVPMGVNKFILEAQAPDIKLIPSTDLLGVTVLLIACSFLDQEFIRVGYYVYNEYLPFEGYNEETHGPVSDLENIDTRYIIRRILADKPRITRFPIQWQGDQAKSPDNPIFLLENNAMSNKTNVLYSNDAIPIDDQDTTMMDVTSPYKSSMDSNIKPKAVTPEDKDLDFLG